MLPKIVSTEQNPEQTWPASLEERFLSKSHFWKWRFQPAQPRVKIRTGDWCCRTISKQQITRWKHLCVSIMLQHQPCGDQDDGGDILIKYSTLELLQPEIEFWKEEMVGARKFDHNPVIDQVWRFNSHTRECNFLFINHPPHPYLRQLALQYHLF